MRIQACSNRPIMEPCTLENHNYQVDPYIGCAHHCYYCYALSQAETDWNEEILFHEDICSRLQMELSEIPPQSIYMGWRTDPYQPCEAECRQTRSVLELLYERGLTVSILTKSDLFLRDADILKEMIGAGVSISAAFNDNNVRRLFEANTIDTEDRIRALAKVKSMGIRTAALICPVMPFITDAVSLVEELAPHTDVIWIYGLSMQNASDQNWQNVNAILDQHFAGLKNKIEEVVFTKAHPYWSRLREDLQAMAMDRGLKLNIHL